MPHRTSLRLALTLIAVASATALTGCSMLTQFLPAGQPQRDDAGVIVEGNEHTDVFSLQVGDCVNDPDDMTEQISSAATVPCDQPHDNEVYYIGELTGDEYPGGEQMAQQSSQLCYDQFEPFVGHEYETSMYDFGSINPSEGSWADGDRQVICLAYAYDGSTMSGTIEGAAE